ncbi:hypothetical protein [Alicyclobacillus fastidiosus]|nr:hypothetical protein [Alicyclobacillus fastidiosus]GMA60253.1 hypothetical protein GCM10025859_06930 [Alicyclobacillus fastidiosus]
MIVMDVQAGTHILAKAVLDHELMALIQIADDATNVCLVGVE